tara:strand:+ start:197 stop:319 length:123 start_codon:yes stop_codon:yes gene_type:complete
VAVEVEVQHLLILLLLVEMADQVGVEILVPVLQELIMLED